MSVTFDRWWTALVAGSALLAVPFLPGCGAVSNDDDDDDDTGETTAPGDDDDTSDGSVSIASLNQAPPADKSEVVTSGIVTAINYKNNFWIMDPAGGNYSGIYIFSQGAYPSGSSLAFKVGDEVKVTGQFTVYFDLREIAVYSDNGSVELTEADAGLPDPIELADVGDLQADGCHKGVVSSMDPYVGAMLSLTGLTVTVVPDKDKPDDTDVCGNKNQYGYWLVEDADGNSVMIDDDVDYAYTPTVGDKIDLVGVLTYNFEQYKIEPIGDAGITVHE